MRAQASAANMSGWFQKTIRLPARSRGSYLITDSIVGQLPELKQYKVGILHLFIQHTSCALSLNENWDSDVRADMSDAIDRLVPEDNRLYRHTAEGSDDMPVRANYIFPLFPRRQLTISMLHRLTSRLLSLGQT